jgi:hypothetical protein
VVNGLLFQFTTDELTKPVPVRSRVASPDPASALPGLTAVTAGTGLLTVKVATADVPPPGEGFIMVTLTVVPSARSLDGNSALRAVAEVKVVVRLVPFHCRTEALTKPVPTTSRVVLAAPAVTVEGVRLVMVGSGLGLPWPLDDELLDPLPHPAATKVNKTKAGTAKRIAPIRVSSYSMQIEDARARGESASLMRAEDSTPLEAWIVRLLFLVQTQICVVEEKIRAFVGGANANYRVRVTKLSARSGAATRLLEPMLRYHAFRATLLDQERIEPHCRYGGDSSIHCEGSGVSELLELLVSFASVGEKQTGQVLIATPVRHVRRIWAGI